MTNIHQCHLYSLHFTLRAGTPMTPTNTMVCTHAQDRHIFLPETSFSSSQLLVFACDILGGSGRYDSSN